MKARKFVPYLVVLVVLMTALILVMGVGRQNSGAQAQPGAAAQATPPQAPPSTGPDLAMAAPTAPTQVLPPATSVLAESGGTLNLAQAPEEALRVYPGFKRVRAARLQDLDALRTQQQTLGTAPSDRRFHFNLFPGISLTGVAENHEKLESPTGNRGVYTGSIDGIPEATFSLAYNDEAISATIVAPPIGRFIIQPAPDHWYRIVELDPENPGNCAQDPERMKELVEKKMAERAAAGLHSDGLVMANDSGVPDVQPLASPSNVFTVDVLVVYTDDLRAFYGGKANIDAVIDEQTAWANQAFVRSLIGARLNISGKSELDYIETSDLYEDLAAVSFLDGKIDNVFTLREQANADLVSFWILGPESEGFLGLAYVLDGRPNDSTFGYSVVRPQFSSMVFAHELGHNFGCAHDRENAGGPGRFEYSYGWRFNAGGNTRVTIMAYEPGEYIQNFSNPDVDYLGVPTGEYFLQANPGDPLIPKTHNALTINQTVEEVVNFRIPGVPNTAVPAPTNVRASDGAYPDAIQVQWDEVVDSIGYNVYRNDTSNSSSGARLIAQRNASTDVFFIDYAVSAGKNYYYFVRAVAPEGLSAFSPGDKGNTRAAALGNLSGVQAGDGNEANFIRVNWNSVPNATSYEIFRNTEASLLGAVRIQHNSNHPEYLDSSIPDGRTYYYYVRARRGASDFSTMGGPDPGRLKTPPKPQKVSGLSLQYVTYNGGYIRAQWNYAADAQAYEVQRAESSNFQNGVRVGLVGSNSREFWDYSGEPGVRYYYRVRGINKGTEGDWSNSQNIMIDVANLLNGPSNFQASDGAEENFIRLSWSQVSNAASYYLYRSTTDNSADAERITTKGNSGAMEFADYNVEQGTTYYYWARTMNSQGLLGSFSTPDTGYLKPSKPPQPSRVKATDGLFLDFVRVSWAPTSGAHKYQIFRGTNSGNVVERVGEVGKSVLFFDDRTATPGRLYYYGVKAVNDHNTASDLSAVDQGFKPDPTDLAPPLPPLDVTASETQESKIVISWTGSFGAAIYDVYRSESASTFGATLIASLDITSYTDYNILLLRPYYYYVVARNAVGTSPPSNVDRGYAEAPEDAERDIVLSKNTLPVFTVPGTEIGVLTTRSSFYRDQDFTYTFATGTGDINNSQFALTGERNSVLVSNFALSAPGLPNQSIRIRSSLIENPLNNIEEVFTIVIVGPGATIAELTQDPDSGNMLLTWPELPGEWFQVQKNSGLDEAGWENVGERTQERSALLATATDGSTCYYRVQQAEAP